MEIRLYVMLLIICSALLAWFWCRRGFSSPSTPMLAFCVALTIARLIALT